MKVIFKKQNQIILEIFLTVCSPKDQSPEIESPKIESPKIEDPKIEDPDIEDPKVEEPVVETKNNIEQICSSVDDKDDEKPSAETNKKVVEAVQPPAGFGDSPDHQAKVPLLLQAEFHEAVIDQPLPQEEQLIMASEELVTSQPPPQPLHPALHITEAFQATLTSEEATEAVVASTEVFTVKKESVTPNSASSCLLQSLEQSKPKQQPRKLSTTSTASRPSTSASKNNAISGSSSHHSRSRSSSKERLLSTLAGSETAPQTTNEVDEVEGN